MAYQSQAQMYPQSNYETAPPLRHSSSSPSLYPTVEIKDLDNLFTDSYDVNAPNTHPYSPSAPPQSSIEETLITVPGAILHLIDKHYSVELATGDLTILCLRHGEDTVAALAAVSDDIQWPLSEDLAAVKLDSSHYFFSLQPPREIEDSDSRDDVEKEVLNYGLTIVSKGQEDLLEELDRVLDTYCSFSVQKLEDKLIVTEAVREVTAGELETDKKKKEAVEGQCAAYWTTLAPNVEEYSGKAARLIASGSGQLIKGILWCGDVTLDRLKWGDEVLKKRISSGANTEIHPSTLKRIQRVKRVTKITEKVANGVLSGVVKVSGHFTKSVANSKVGKTFFRLLPGEVVLASLDGFSRMCDALEVAGKNVMSTSSNVTTGLVSQRYGEEAGKAANEGLGAAGHAVGTAWTVFKIRKALNPKSALNPATMAKLSAKSSSARKKSSKSPSTN
ncbi:hypothetical protein BUALT_Bualt11G0044100 [Buddleja alternifolia]|uniref:Senescence domain-containing protein n=1 Tax=Buddleja alternifolia TaxID=168488 RepID=A0AAV6WU67_9LAMI|nr:hypothetical protein BUALT_Bualt11G0044100 [Buddleja alternifolia]